MVTGGGTLVPSGVAAAHTVTNDELAQRFIRKPCMRAAAIVTAWSTPGRE